MLDANKKLLAHILSKSQVPMSIALELKHKACDINIPIEMLTAAREELKLFGYLTPEAIEAFLNDQIS